jgi:DNA-binding MarR family transcriptional regulator
MNEQIELTEIIAVISAIMAEMESKAFADEIFGQLTMRQIAYLDKIMHMDEPTFSELADEWRISKPSVSAIVGTLIRKGFVEKVQDHDDKRVYHVVITEKGREFDKIHQQVHAQMVNSLLSGLDQEEIRLLTNILKKAMKN